MEEGLGWVASNDVIVSLAAGAVLGALILIGLTLYPGEPIDYGRMADGSEVPEGIRLGGEAKKEAVPPRETEGGEEEEEDFEVNEDAVVQRFGASKANKLLGLSEEQIREAVRKAKREMKDPEAVAASYQSDKPSFVYWFDAIFYLTAFAVGGYFLYRDYGETLIPFLTRILPREMSAFGFSSSEGEL